MQKQSWTNKATRQKQANNHSSESKSFLQRQHRLAKQMRGANRPCRVIPANIRSRHDIRVPGCRECASSNARTPVLAYPKG
ncbi:CACTA en-spm transposon protein [Cucumis melo var. makuwa]|uniref:CACTA en-spm transposon protein n=1 Tax=Cucumis melo var. makuwa TaxID=1194695 RepID=A0A5D3CE30_CUCMM|nr:CACTA en-spm transposon protein [Cucumis melo var. makuwa]TYK08599.1 CACTA en-spm transposon protein [Cucumis melo var. makuwa]